MNEKLIDLLLWIRDQGIEYRIENDESIIIWITFYDIPEFMGYFDYSDICEGNISCTLLQDCIGLNLMDLISGYDEEEYIVKKLKEWSEE